MQWEIRENVLNLRRNENISGSIVYIRKHAYRLEEQKNPYHPYGHVKRENHIEVHVYLDNELFKRHHNLSESVFLAIGPFSIYFNCV